MSSEGGDSIAGQGSMNSGSKGQSIPTQPIQIYSKNLSINTGINPDSIIGNKVESKQGVGKNQIISPNIMTSTAAGAKSSNLALQINAATAVGFRRGSDS